MKFLLLVTWFVAGQVPTSYQVPFEAGDGCTNAAAQLQREAERLTLNHKAVVQENLKIFTAQSGVIPAPALGGPLYSISAICVSIGKGE